MQISYKTEPLSLKGPLWLFSLKDSIDRNLLEFAGNFPDPLPINLILQAYQDESPTLYLEEGKIRLHLFRTKAYTFSAIKNLAAEAIFNCRKLDTNPIILIDLALFSAQALEAISEGLWWGGQNLGLHKTSDEVPARAWNISLAGNESRESMEVAISKGSYKGALLEKIGGLVNEPGNVCTPQYMADFALREAENRPINIRIHSAEDIQREGLWGLWNVGKGSSYPPVMIEMDYHPEKCIATVGLVGKGVTFDTGGVSLKDGKNMHYMKSDMGGAAAVLGTILAAADLHLPIRLIGIIPSAENHIDRLAYRPGDVISSYSGKTIEIINTDAEGRLLLADGLSYILKNYTLDHLIDLATLTGSAVQTFGYLGGALFSNNASLSDELMKASIESGEKIWPLPLWEEYEKEIESTIADIRHFHNSPLAGAAVAAKFLESFIGGFASWAHLDIAAVALKETVFSKEKVGTGFGVDLLISWLENFQGN